MTRTISRQTQGLVAINLAAVIFGSAALYGKLKISPFWIVGMRALFAAFALFVLAMAKSQLAWPIQRKIPMLLFTGVLLSIHWLTFFVSVQVGGIATATLTYAAFPLFTVIIETIRVRRKPHFSELLAGAAIFGAVKLLVEINLQGTNESLSAIAGLGSAFAFACFGIASQKLSSTTSPLLLSLYQNIAVSFVLLPILPFIGNRPTTTMDWTFLMLLGVLTTALMHQLYFYALQRLSASICSSFVALEPVYAVIFASLLFKEAITYRVIISATLILSASLLLLRFENSQIVSLKNFKK